MQITMNQARTTSPSNLEEIANLTEKILTLEGRLEKGWQLYTQEADRAKKERIYLKWLGLLREYEGLCDKRRELGYAAAPPE